MLTIEVKSFELFNEETREFINSEGGILHLEHSLLSISKWEQKWHKPFLLDTYEKTNEEMLYYIKCMCITTPKDENIFYGLSSENYEKINNYINDPMTATTFSEDKEPKKKSSEYITNELIYYWMFSYQIPVEFEKWHINRLMTLIRIFNVKNAPPKKMSRQEIGNKRRSLNQARKAALNSKG